MVFVHKLWVSIGHCVSDWHDPLPHPYRLPVKGFHPPATISLAQIVLGLGWPWPSPGGPRPCQQTLHLSSSLLCSCTWHWSQAALSYLRGLLTCEGAASPWEAVGLGSSRLLSSPVEQGPQHMVLLSAADPMSGLAQGEGELGCLSLWPTHSLPASTLWVRYQTLLA